jgi:hypothetical protein
MDGMRARSLIWPRQPQEMQRQAPPHPAWADHSEPALPRQLAPEPGICPRAHTTTMRGDDERQRRWGTARPIPSRRDDDRPAQHTVVSAVPDPPVLDCAAHTDCLHEAGRRLLVVA